MGLDPKQQENIFRKMINAKSAWMNFIGIGFLSDDFKERLIKIIRERFDRIIWIPWKQSNTEFSFHLSHLNCIPCTDQLSNFSQIQDFAKVVDFIEDIITDSPLKD